MSYGVEDRRAIPSVLKSASHKPEAIHAVRRRVRTITLGNNKYNFGNHVTIPIDTANHGAFMDPKSTQLEFDVEIHNANPYVDFQNWPRCGANIVFQEMRVLIAGKPIEENLHYAESFEFSMLQKNMNARVWDMFKPNRYYDQFGYTQEQTMNLIKPCMVDALGLPMYAGSWQGLCNEWAYEKPPVAPGTATEATLGAYIARFSKNGYMKNLSAARDIGLFPYVDANDPGLNLLAAMTAARIAPATMEGRVNIIANGVAYNTVIGVVSAGTVIAIDDELMLVTGTAQVEGQANQTELSVIRGFGQTGISEHVITSPIKVIGRAPNSQEHPSTTAANWPINQPYWIGACDERAHGGRVQDYSAFLSNTRAYPIGVRPLPGAAYYEPTGGSGYEGSSIVYHCSTEILSGVLGTLAEKYWPSLLIGPGKMTLDFTLAAPEKVFWFTMDPCRRIPDTPRDYCVFKREIEGVDNTNVGNYEYMTGLTPATGAVKPAYAKYLNDVGESIQLITGPENNPVVYAYGRAVAASREACFGQSPYYFGDVPMMQYALVTKASKALHDKVYLREVQACYGTYLSASVPQTRRVHTAAIPKLAQIHSSVPGTLSQTTYQISNVEFVAEEVLLPDVVTATLLQEANSGEIGMHTEMIRTYQTSCIQSETQQIQVPVRLVQASQVSFVFRHQDQLNGDIASCYNSLSFINPFTHITSTASDAYDLDTSFTVDSALDSGSRKGINIRLNLGNTQYPAQPINSLVELLKENDKASHIKQNCEQSGPSRVQASFYTNESIKSVQYGLFEDQGFLTPHVPLAVLDDQTLTGNPYMSYGTAVAETNQTRYAARRNAVGAKLFTPPTGTFHISMDLETFQNTSDTLRSGTPIVNHQMVLQFEQAKALARSIHRCDVIIPHSARISFQSGGEASVVF